MTPIPKAWTRHGLALALAVLLMAALHVAWPPASAEPGRAGRFRLNAQGAVRIGLFDPHPRFCGGAELTQRDLRVLRMAFGVNRDPAARRQPPWYLEPVAGEYPRIMLRLRTGALWDIPADWLLEPDGTGQAAPNSLARWRDRLAELLELEPAPAGGEGALLRLDEAGPFAWSRLHGSAALPRVEGWHASSLGEHCPAWPAGVWLEPGEGEWRYVLTVSRREHGRPFVLSGYRREAALWSDLRRGQLDVALVEGEEAGGLGGSGEWVWGAEAGTQQFLLLASPRLREELGRERWGALALALPREDLSALYGPGRIAPAKGFLAPLLPARAAPPPLQDNPREARRIWLNDPKPRPRLSLATLANPVLEALARRIGEQWQRTLNVKTGVTSLPVDGFASSLADWEHDLYLTVADLDDGSLQDLWEHTLGQAAQIEQGRALTEARLLGWEQALLRDLPYVPVAENMHHAVARDGALIRAVCPACEVPVRPPMRIRPPPAPSPEQPVVPPEG